MLVDRVVSIVHTIGDQYRLVIEMSSVLVTERSAPALFSLRLMEKKQTSPCPMNTSSWRGLGGRIPSKDSIEFDKQLDKISLWIEKWEHLEVSLFKLCLFSELHRSKPFPAACHNKTIYRLFRTCKGPMRSCVLDSKTIYRLFRTCKGPMRSCVDSKTIYRLFRTCKGPMRSVYLTVWVKQSIGCFVHVKGQWDIVYLIFLVFMNFIFLVHQPASSLVFCTFGIVTRFVSVLFFRFAPI
jgi:hypothetical protein